MRYLLEHKADIIKYLPFFMQEYLEMQEITETEDIEFNWLIDILIEMLNNQFITTCDEEGIARFEQLLQIIPYSNDSLEQRINRVLVLWNNKVPYTMKTLKQMLETLCGTNGYQVILNNNAYELLINTYFNDTNMLKALNDMLNRVVPANLTIINQSYVTEELFSTFNYVEVCTFSVEYVLQHQVDDKALLLNSLNTVETFVSTRTYNIGGK